MVSEVGVEPLASRVSSSATRHGKESGADSLPAGFCRDHRVLDPRVHQAIPDDIHEANEPVAVPRRDPAEAVFANEFLPAPFRLVEDSSLEGFSMELVDLSVVEVAPPFARDRHGLTLDLYSHTTPTMQAEGAAQVDALIFGSGA